MNYKKLLECILLYYDLGIENILTIYNLNSDYVINKTEAQKLGLELDKLKRIDIAVQKVKYQYIDEDGNIITYKDANKEELILALKRGIISRIPIIKGNIFTELFETNEIDVIEYNFNLDTLCQQLNIDSKEEFIHTLYKDYSITSRELLLMILKLQEINLEKLSLKSLEEEYINIVLMLTNLELLVKRNRLLDMNGIYIKDSVECIVRNIEAIKVNRIMNGIK